MPVSRSCKAKQNDLNQEVKSEKWENMQISNSLDHQADLALSRLIHFMHTTSMTGETEAASSPL